MSLYRVTQALGTENIGRCRAGFQVCRDGVLGPCEASRIPIEEICNGADDDCDGSADEELLNACGQCGDLPDEECNGSDDDCDGRVDETVQNRCGGCGEEPKEFCDGLDNDCDGRMDEECQCLTNVKEVVTRRPEQLAWVCVIKVSRAVEMVCAPNV